MRTPKELSRRRTNPGELVSSPKGRFYANPTPIRRGSVQQYIEQLSDPDRYRPDHCPQCPAKRSLTAHGFYTRTLIEVGFDGVIAVRRYLCQSCRRTVSLLPEFALPYLRFSLVVIALFLIARLLDGRTLQASLQTVAAAKGWVSYQRGQFWVRRFRRQAETMCGALAALTRPTLARDFTRRALQMLQSTGWIAAHRFLFADLRNTVCCEPATNGCFAHCAITCWAGPVVWLPTAAAPHSLRLARPPEGPHTPFAWNRRASCFTLWGRRKNTDG